MRKKGVGRGEGLLCVCVQNVPDMHTSLFTASAFIMNSYAFFLLMVGKGNLHTNMFESV